VTALKAADVPRRFSAIEKLPPLILVFGPDRGLVVETTERITRLFDAAGDDPFAIVRLDAGTVAADPARLVDEAGTVSLFGGRRLVVVRDGGGRNLSPAVGPLLRRPPEGSVVVVEAGDLKRGVGLRKEVEDDRAAAAVYCPPDDPRDIERVVDEEAGAFGLVVASDARAALVERVGADRAASRSEIRKACLHAAGTGHLTLADVDAVVGDAGVAELGEAVNAAFLGQREVLDRALARVLRADSAAVTLLMAAQRTSQALELAAADEGRAPFYGAQKAAMARILARWTPEALRAASGELAAAIWSTRIMPSPLAAAIARDALLRIVSFRPKG
jgi:DNA polymerase-3 subunit delta